MNHTVWMNERRLNCYLHGCEAVNRSGPSSSRETPASAPFTWRGLIPPLSRASLKILPPHRRYMRRGASLFAAVTILLKVGGPDALHCVCGGGKQCNQNAGD